MAGIPAIGRWKMLDNLRRSLSAPSVVLALIAGWAMPFDDAAVWTGFHPVDDRSAASHSCDRERSRAARAGVTLRSHVRALGAELRLALVQSGLMIVFLAHQAWLMGDAIVRTLVRLTMTRRHLLEWVPAAHAAFGSPSGRAAFLPADGRGGRHRRYGDSRRLVLGTGNLADGRRCSLSPGSPRRRSRSGRASRPGSRPGAHSTRPMPTLCA